jgi:site-specific recombinase XerD
MTHSLDFPELLQSFFSNRLIAQRQASPHTIAAYRDTFRLLLQFAHQTLGKPASQITLENLNAPFITAFLDSLERDRGNAVRTRNVRMTVIRSFFRYTALESPQHAALSSGCSRFPASATTGGW